MCDSRHSSVFKSRYHMKRIKLNGYLITCFVSVENLLVSVFDNLIKKAWDLNITKRGYFASFYLFHWSIFTCRWNFTMISILFVITFSLYMTVLVKNVLHLFKFFFISNTRVGFFFFNRIWLSNQLPSNSNLNDTSFELKMVCELRGTWQGLLWPSTRIIHSPTVHLLVLGVLICM